MQELIYNHTCSNQENLQLSFMQVCFLIDLPYWVFQLNDLITCNYNAQLQIEY